MEFREEFLMHYGVPGMRWGHRKQYVEATKQARSRLYSDREAAINRSDALTRSNAAKYAGNRKAFRQAESANVKQLKKDYRSAKDSYNQSKKAAKAEYKNSEEYKAKRKKAIIAGTAVAGTALAAYGAYKLSKYINNANSKMATKRGAEAASKFMNSDLGKSMSAMERQVRSSGGTVSVSAFDKAARAASNKAYLKTMNASTADKIKNAYEYTKLVRGR